MFLVLFFVIFKMLVFTTSVSVCLEIRKETQKFCISHLFITAVVALALATKECLAAAAKKNCLKKIIRGGKKNW